MAIYRASELEINNPYRAASALRNYILLCRLSQFEQALTYVQRRFIVKHGPEYGNLCGILNSMSVFIRQSINQEIYQPQNLGQHFTFPYKLIFPNGKPDRYFFANALCENQFGRPTMTGVWGINPISATGEITESDKIQNLFTPENLISFNSAS